MQSRGAPFKTRVHNRGNDISTPNILWSQRCMHLTLRTHAHLRPPAVTFEGQGPAGRAGFERLHEVEGRLVGGVR